MAFAPPTLLTLILSVFLRLSHGAAQGIAQPAAPVTGLIYFAVENLDTQRVDQRGVAGNAGVAFDRLNLASNTRYRIWLLEAATLRVADVQILTPAPGIAVRLPDFFFRTASSHDRDGDGIHDLGEFIVGTDPFDTDSDDDGLLDGPEVLQGLDALSGRAVRTGIIDTVDTPGTAVDICAINDLAIVADRAAGISVFNVFNGMNAVLIAQVDTPGDALAVACSGNLVAVADGPAGLAVVDITDPPAAALRHQVTLGASAQAVTAAGPIAYVGLSNGDLVMVDLSTGIVLDRLALRAAIQDVALAGDYLYALVVGRLYVLPLDEAGLQVLASVEAPGQQGAGRRRLRLFAGDRLLYATFTSGYNIFDITAPAIPRLAQRIETAQFGWKQIVANGSGLALAAVSPNSTDDGPHHVSRYGVGAEGTQSAFQTEFETPGLAAALSIYNGIAYVADSAAGMQVINYLAYDALGQPPSISLQTGFAEGRAEEGKLMRLTARVMDDVQVRNVEFYVDGAKVATDGNFPFEHRFLTPLIAAGKRSFTVRARASDTGGNATWSQELTFELVPDARPPAVRRTVPFHGALVGAIASVSAFFSEPVAEATVSAATVQLLSAGPDDVLDTPDDAPVGGTVAYRATLNAAVFLPTQPLPPGNYRFTVLPPIADLAGNPLAAPVTARFRVFSFTDDDQDGMPDELEAGLGLNPTNPDTDGDGVPDGLEDLDNDGLPNAGEILAQTDPRDPDSDGDGVLDGDEDPDNDALSNAREFAAGTNPRLADTDGDGWNDETEVTAGSDPLNPASVPRRFVASRPPVGGLIVALSAEGPGRVVAPGVFVARPPLSGVVPSVQAAGAGAAGSFVARPPVAVARTAVTLEAEPRAFVVGRPPLDVQIGP